MLLKRYRLTLLSLLSGVLLSLAWPMNGFAWFLFISFVPLLFVEYTIYKNSNKYRTIHVFNYASFTFFWWNLLTIWWVYNSSLFGGIAAVLLNTMLMSIVFTLFHVTKKRMGEIPGYIALVVYWIAFEYLHLDWDLSWPWLTLGNGFAEYYKLIQWYEYTGVFGGTLWILVVNVLCFLLFRSIQFNKELVKENDSLTDTTSPSALQNGEDSGKDFAGKRSLKSLILFLSLLIFLPITLSFLMYNSYQEKQNPVNVVVVQPNIDPYNEKFDGSFSEQLTKMLELGIEKLDTTTDYLVFPETALQESLWENKLENTSSVNTLKHFLQQYPNLKIIIGAATYRAFDAYEQHSATARKFKSDEGFYDAYNTAFQIDNTPKIQIYHKSKLVPGVEKMPFPSLLKPLEKLALDLGGTVGSLGIQKERSVFSSFNDSLTIAPIICYESIYGEYVSQYVKNGADLLCIITNDGWWGDTPGYRQHLVYGRVRAIETRRSVARSANTGVSCLINQKGDILQATQWWKPEVIKGVINANSSLTFYTKHGDYIARYSSFFAILLLLLTSIKFIYGRVRKLYGILLLKR